MCPVFSVYLCREASFCSGTFWVVIYARRCCRTFTLSESCCLMKSQAVSVQKESCPWKSPSLLLTWSIDLPSLLSGLIEELALITWPQDDEFNVLLRQRSCHMQRSLPTMKNTVGSKGRRSWDPCNVYSLSFKTLRREMWWARLGPVTADAQPAH